MFPKTKQRRNKWGGGNIAPSIKCGDEMAKIKRMTGAQVKNTRLKMKLDQEQFGNKFDRSERFIQEKESKPCVDLMFTLAIHGLKSFLKKR